MPVRPVNGSVSRENARELLEVEVLGNRMNVGEGYEKRDEE